MENAARIMENSWNFIFGNGWKPCKLMFVINLSCSLCFVQLIWHFARPVLLLPFQACIILWRIKWNRPWIQCSKTLYDSWLPTGQVTFGNILKFNRLCEIHWSCWTCPVNFEKCPMKSCNLNNQMSSEKLVNSSKCLASLKKVFMQPAKWILSKSSCQPAWKN